MPELCFPLSRINSEPYCEREKVQAVVCNENPYAAIWQPTEEPAKYSPRPAKTSSTRRVLPIPGSATHGSKTCR